MKKTFTLLTTLLVITLSYAQPVLEFDPVTLSGPALLEPVDITGCGDGSGRLFIVEKRGSVRIIQNNVVLADYFLDIHTDVMNSGERGLLGMTFHPQYPDSPYIYVNYVPIGTITNRISRFTLSSDPNDIDEDSELIYFEQVGVQSNHKAGDLAFGLDGYLYIGMGDGGGGGDPANSGQDLNILRGKILRIDVNSTTGSLNYGIPPDNPFVDTAGLDEIWAYGLRNPWRISFDSQTGDLWIGDVGQDEWEEIDMIPFGSDGGMNFGWDCREGNHDYQPNNCANGTVFTSPVFEYPHSCGNPCPTGHGSSLTGGFVYRGDEYPVLQGCYICADYGSNYLWIIKQTGTNPNTFDFWVQDGTGDVNDLVTFGEDDNGELYASNLGGTLYAVSGSGFLALNWVDVSATIVAGGNKIDWTIHETFGVNHFQIQRSLKPTFEDSIVVAQIEPVNDKIHYSFIDPFLQPEAVYYRIVAAVDDGTNEYSPIVRTRPDQDIKPSLVFESNANIWRINLPDSWRTGELQLYDLQGKEVYKQTIAQEQHIELNSPLVPGTYFVEINSEMGKWSDKIVWQ